MNGQELKSEELVFTDKERDCTDCDKGKEVELKLGLTPNEEWQKIIKLLEKFKLENTEVEYIYNFYNRVFNTNKRPGCAKCMRNIAIHLKNRWSQINK